MTRFQVTLRNDSLRWMRGFLPTVAVMVLLAGCRQEPAAPGHSTSVPGATAGTAATNRQVFQVKGVVREVLPEKKKIKIAHEEIPGYMEAMTMMLDVKEGQELKGLAAGDTIQFRMVVTDDDGWVENLQKIDGPRTPLPAEAPVRRVKYVEALAVGDILPDYAFTNMQGRVLRLSGLKGRAVAFTFIFTRCPFPTFCPRLNTSFQQTQNKMKALTNAPANWTLLSITMDPEFDTPAKLKTYSEQYKPDPQHWEFVTGDLTDITAIGEQFGLQFWRPSPNEPISHNVRTVVVDSTGRVQWVSNDNEFKSDELVEQLVKASAIKSPTP